MKSLGIRLTGVMIIMLLGCTEVGPPVPAPAGASPQTPSSSEPTATEQAPPAAPTQTSANAPAPRQPSSTTKPQAGRDWPSFLGPNRDSKSPETGILTDWPEQGPPIVWQRELGEGYGIGSIADGRYFQFDRTGEEARLVALDARSGELLWEFRYRSHYRDLYGYDAGPRASPVVDGERVYIYGVEGMLHCLSAATGELHWKVDVNERFGVVQNFFGVGSTPIVEQDLLLVMVGGSPPESQQVAPGAIDRVLPNGSGIVAFDKLTGEVKYKVCDDLASYSSPMVATIGGRRWALAFLRSGLWAFDPAQGGEVHKYVWRAKSLESVNASTPVIIDDQVFISETYGPGSSLLKLTPDGFEVVWRDDFNKREKSMQTHWNTAVHVDGYLYGSSGRHEYNAELRCIEKSTGKVTWAEPGLSRASLLWADDHFICLGEDGTLRLLRVNPEKYDLVSEVVLRDWTAEPSTVGLPPPRLLKPPAWAAPVLSHGLLYVRGEDRVVCLELIPGAAEP